VQYAVFSADQTLYEYAGGLADIRNQKSMRSSTTLMAYSMTKTRLLRDLDQQFVEECDWKSAE
jgi:hypothetical protein